MLDSKVEDITFKIFKENILSKAKSNWAPSFRNYVRGSATVLMNAGLLGFFTLISKKSIRGTSGEANAYLALLYCTVKFLEKLNVKIEFPEEFTLEELMSNSNKKEKFIEKILETVASINNDLERRMFYTDMLMKFLTWMKNFAEALIPPRKSKSTG